MSDEDKPDRRGFKVEDRRRFSETGEARADRDDTPRAEAPPERPAPGGPATSEAAPQDAHADAPLFDLNFSTFIISLSTQALAHLGEIESPIDGQRAVDLVAAKQLIDILGILKEKTKGNLDAAESGLLDNVLYDLRLRYVERARGPSERP